MEEKITLTREAYERIIAQAEKNTRIETKLEGVEKLLKDTCNNGGCRALGTMKGWVKAHSWMLGTLLIILSAFFGVALYHWAK